METDIDGRAPIDRLYSVVPIALMLRYGFLPLARRREDPTHNSALHCHHPQQHLNPLHNSNLHQLYRPVAAPWEPVRAASITCGPTSCCSPPHLRFGMTSLGLISSPSHSPQAHLTGKLRTLPRRPSLTYLIEMLYRYSSRTEKTASPPTNLPPPQVEPTLSPTVNGTDTAKKLNHPKKPPESCYERLFSDAGA
jgi:hypothetical protein